MEGGVWGATYVLNTVVWQMYYAATTFQFQTRSVSVQRAIFSWFFSWPWPASYALSGAGHVRDSHTIYTLWWDVPGGSWKPRNSLDDKYFFFNGKPRSFCSDIVTVSDPYIIEKRKTPKMGLAWWLWGNQNHFYSYNTTYFVTKRWLWAGIEKSWESKSTIWLY